MTNPMLPATFDILTTLVDDIFVQLDGIPEDDLNTWLPRDGMRDVNTFFALATHTVGAGEYWILEAAGCQPVDRNRSSEFGATGTIEQLRNRYAQWLEATAAVFATIDDATLASIYVRPANPERGMSEARRSRAECIAHALEHTAVHLGHLQLQRQLWDAEQAA
ncbi:MAG: DinB family protein [Thermomicrobiales bacterium]|nr:DinB family protein [Thermomicrobiales bacterium]MCO5220589.1 DinB family protein [Thermomicrobiales bacterium]